VLYLAGAAVSIALVPAAMTRALFPTPQRVHVEGALPLVTTATAED